MTAELAVRSDGPAECRGVEVEYGNKPFPNRLVRAPQVS